ncbi:hypothetical protein [Leucobacter sp. GX24907]
MMNEYGEWNMRISSTAFEPLLRIAGRLRWAAENSLPELAVAAIVAEQRSAS